MLQTEAIQARRGGFTRRKFIKGVVAAGATASVSGYLFRETGVFAPMLSAQGAVERLITLNVNGQQRRVDVPKYETLAMTLRYQLGLTGTKLGCDRAECGACTVLLDGVTHYGCSILTHSVQGREVATIEGLEQDGELHPVQQAVMDEGGFQCAFCAPRLRDEHGRDAREEPESDPRGGGGAAFGQPLPLRRLRQDPEHRDAGGRAVPFAGLKGD